jgi:pimeloyl-ACP methyl ester carboxylesterase
LSRSSPRCRCSRTSAPSTRPFYDHLASLADRCLTRGEVIADHMSTADVVRDLDLLRQAVGDPKLTYLGFSYGSYIGNTYANLFPQNIRALVIDGVLDPRLWSSGWQIRSDRVATQKEFDEFLRLCREAGPRCAFASGRSTARRWEALARAVEDEPIDLGDGTLYTYDFLITDASGAMYAPEVWGGPEGFGAFLDFLADAALGDRAAGRRARTVRRAVLAEMQARPAREADYDNGYDAYYGNQCADTQYPGSFLEFRVIDAYARAGSRFGPNWWWANNGCTAWPVAEDRYVGPWRVRTSAPVLVVGNFFDGVTDHAGARASSRSSKTAACSAMPAGATRRTAEANARRSSSTPTFSTARCRLAARSVPPIRTPSSRRRPDRQQRPRPRPACRRRGCCAPSRKASARPCQRRAAAASIRPCPYLGSKPGGPRSRAVRSISRSTAPGFGRGPSRPDATTSAARPAAWGAAIDVP